jgi:type I restriction enzyme S subunit
MKWEKVKINDIANNLDYRRKPLNDQERALISNEKLYPYIGANNIMGYVDEFLFDEDILCIAEDGGSWGKNGSVN